MLVVQATEPHHVGMPMRDEIEEQEVMALPALRITEDLEDSWLRLGAPSGLLAHLKEAELQAMSAPEPIAPLPGLVRGAALRCLSRMMQAMTRAQSGWFKAVMLLDCYSLKFAVPVTELPMTCLSIARITLKFDHNSEQVVPYNMQYSPFEQISTCAEDFKAWLSSGGFDVPPITEEHLRKLETEILRRLGWQADIPCVERWCTVYVTRLSILSGMFLGPEMQQVLHGVQVKLVVLAQAIVMCHPLSRDLTHGRLALGLLCLGLVEAGLVPVSELRPSDVSLTDWTAMCLSSQPGGAVPDCTRSPAEINRIFEMLLVSAETDFDDLKKAVRRVVEVLGTTLTSIQHLQMQR